MSNLRVISMRNQKLPRCRARAVSSHSIIASIALSMRQQRGKLPGTYSIIEKDSTSSSTSRSDLFFSLSVKFEQDAWEKVVIRQILNNFFETIVTLSIWTCLSQSWTFGLLHWSSIEVQVGFKKLHIFLRLLNNWAK